MEHGGHKIASNFAMKGGQEEEKKSRSTVCKKDRDCCSILRLIFPMRRMQTDIISSVLIY